MTTCNKHSRGDGRGIFSKIGSLSFAWGLAAVSAGVPAAPFNYAGAMPAPTNVVAMVYSPAYGALAIRNSASAAIAIDLLTGDTSTRYANVRFTDIALAPSGRYVFAADYGGENIGAPLNTSHVHRLDLATMAWESRIAHIAARVQSVSDTQVILSSMDQWVTFTNNLWGSDPALTIVNAPSGVPWSPGYYATVYFGNFRYDPSTQRLIHGNSDLSSQEIQAFRIVGYDFVKQEGTGVYGSAQGYGGSVVLATDASAFYYGRLQVDALDVTFNRRVFPEIIHAASGSVAFGDGCYYDAYTGTLLGTLPFSTTVYALSPSGNEFWAFDAGRSMLRRYVSAPRLPLGDDLDYDARSDIVWRNVATGEVNVWFMSGLALLPASGTIAILPSPQWSILGSGDFDGDGRGDLLLRHATTGDLAIWLMDGRAVKPGSAVFATLDASRWLLAGIGDANADGTADILWYDALTGNVHVWLMNGTTLLPGSAVAGGAPPGVWTVLSSGDFDGDGRIDLLWRNTATGDLNVWFLNGAAMRPGSGYVSNLNPGRWQVAGIGDVNADGSADIVWRDTLNGDVYVWMMNGLGWLPGSGPVAPAPLAVWDIVGTGDYDGDGRADLLWRSNDHRIATWFLNGAAIRPGSGTVGSVGSADWQAAR